MRKLFFLIPAMFAVMANATETIIGSTDPTAVNSDVLTVALQSANDGDVIILRDGTYNEYSNYIDFNKSVEVKAAEGANPLVNVGCYIKLQGGKNIVIKGIKFNGTEQGHNGNTYYYFFRFYDNAATSLTMEDCEICYSANEVIICENSKGFSQINLKNCYFHHNTKNAISVASPNGGTINIDGCEFEGFPKEIITGSSLSHISECTISNSYFHDCTNSAVYFATNYTIHACNRLEITNSTFANFSGFNAGVISLNSKSGKVMDSPDDDVEVNVDHCTFYNFSKTDESSTWGCIDVRKSTKTTISNSIFVNPAELPEGSKPQSNSIVWRYRF